MGVTVVKSLAEFREIINSNKVSVFDFWATWCGPCRIISPIFEQLSGKVESVHFYKVDVDEQPEVAEEVGIRAMPTFMVFKDGQKVKELVGAKPADLEALVNSGAKLVSEPAA